MKTRQLFAVLAVLHAASANPQGSCTVGVWPRRYAHTSNITVTNLLSLLPDNASSPAAPILTLRNVYSRADGTDTRPNECVVTIGPYLLNVAANTTLNIDASKLAVCTENLQTRCSSRGAVCRPDSAFDETDSFVCRNQSVLEMHDGSAGSVIVFTRLS